MEKLLMYYYSVPYYTLVITIFFTSVLVPRKRIPRPRRTLFFITLLFITVIARLRVLMPQVGVYLIQIYLVLIIFLYFQGPLRDQIYCYLLFVVTASIAEIISVNIFILLNYRSLPLDAYNTIEFSRLNDPFLIIVLALINYLIGTALFIGMVRLLKRCSGTLNLLNLLVLLLPFYIPLLAQWLVYYRNEKHYLLLSVIYWLLCLCGYPLFIREQKKIRQQEKKRIIKQKLVGINKEQLAISRQLEQEYLSLHRWNHDIKNHCSALNYLMDTQEYEKAAAYCRDILPRAAAQHTVSAVPAAGPVHSEGAPSQRLPLVKSVTNEESP